MSRQRELILNIIRSSHAHLSAEQIFQAARQQMPTIVRATIYNNINTLCREGEIRRVGISNGADLFDRTTAQHGHLLCTVCGRISDLPLNSFQNRLQNELGFAIDGYDLTVRYTCPDCRSGAESSDRR